MSVKMLAIIHKRLWMGTLRKFSAHSNPYPLANEDFAWAKQRDSFAPLHNGQFNIVSFNMLAPCYKRLTTRDSITGRRIRESSNFDQWSGRAKRTLAFFQKEIFAQKTAIVALQEYWLDTRYTGLFHQEFVRHGYEVNMLQRTGPKVDAVALMVRSDVFETLGSENVYLCAVADRVALMLWLRHRATGKNLLVVNTHLSFPHTASERQHQLQQMRLLTSFIDGYAAQQRISSATRIVLGDFNVEGSSPVCDHLRAAGYYSAFEVAPPHNGRTNSSETVAKLRAAELERAAHLREQQFPTHMSFFSQLVSNHDGYGSTSRVVTACSEATQMPPPHTATGGGFSCNHAVSFVSHHTHKAEDLGVDHIFVRPECSWAEVDKAHHSHSEDATNEAQTITAAQACREDDELSIALAAATVVSTTTEQATVTHKTAVLTEGVFVGDTAVLPGDVPCGEWLRDFGISDHRPVQTTLVFAEQKKDKATHDTPFAAANSASTIANATTRGPGSNRSASSFSRGGSNSDNAR